MKKSSFDTKALLAKMTLEEKVGQLIQLNSMFLGETTADILKSVAHLTSTALRR